jgi:hypothetical protein
VTEGKYDNLTAGELAQGIAETRNALERGRKTIEKIATLGAQKPRLWADTAESIARLSEHLRSDLKALEDAMVKYDGGQAGGG